MRLPFLLIYIVLLFSTACSNSSENIDLELQYKKEDEFIIVMTTEATSPDISYDSYEELKFTVDSITNQGYSMRFDVVQIKDNSKIDGKKQTYDSNKSESEMTEVEKEMHEEFRSTLASTWTYAMNRKGKITSPFQYSDGTAAEPPLDMENLQIVFPSKSLKVGSTWTNEKENLLTSAKTSTTYTIKTISADKITITVEAKIGGVKGLINDSKATGEYILDRKSNMLISAILEMNLATGGKAVSKIYRK